MGSKKFSGDLLRVPSIIQVKFTMFPVDIKTHCYRTWKLDSETRSNCLEKFFVPNSGTDHKKNKDINYKSGN